MLINRRPAHHATLGVGIDRSANVMPSGPEPLLSTFVLADELDHDGNPGVHGHQHCAQQRFYRCWAQFGQGLSRDARCHLSSLVTARRTVHGYRPWTGRAIPDSRP
jgi:hypothetical protein